VSAVKANICFALAVLQRFLVKLRVPAISQ
jgi:hypothetical protein